ncbi:uncharacterized protein EV154DRAFT_505134 [Mucor mucedo]|uniref:uncharacterized protein n=1 Tax=Mucor mucedo TaxID=29922 RepID=UPI00221F0551|nr:uncharacterized protein EV154DRAFT_505134 [Mucor mucedo]KAI7892433.1 hypothetical protein EV154DRAFT_505134 [Mucor mucedo]
MEYVAVEAIKHYNGGIMFVSYLVAVAGAQTTLELLNRRTHISGIYNWFLLSAAAFSMGAVSVWAMHFIGNNSLMLQVRGDKYQLNYSAGYTFGSLIVAIACMFIAFAFVGITEEARFARILPSGIFAGLGIVCMHYMGQFAIDYFVLVYLNSYIVGAAFIAMTAVTVALYIFFKLRERWMDTWYKRFGCALIMGLAVCGMHYTALVGTIFYKPNYSSGPPVPKLQTPALIGIISAVTVSACIGLIYFSIKTGIKNLPLYIKNTNKRLILDSVIFDPMGRILVKIDGTLPMTEIVHNLELNETKQSFTTKHPLFIRLYEAAVMKASLKYNSDKRPSGISSTSSIEAYEAIERQFLNATHELRDELRFDHFDDLGILSDIVVTTDTISKATMFNKSQVFRNSSGTSLANLEVTSGTLHQRSEEEDEEDMCSHPTTKKKKPRHKDGKKKSSSKTVATTTTDGSARKSTSWSVMKSFADDEETVIEGLGKRSSGSTTIVTNGVRSSSDEDGKSVNDRLSVEDSDGEDKHIFLVRKLVDDRDVSKLLSQGYRFAEPIFIAKTMATKLRIPTDWMRQHFLDMQQMSDSVCALTQHDWLPSTVEPAPNPTEFKASTKSSVYLGAFVLLDETPELTNTQIVIDKTKRFAFPMEEIVLHDQSDAPTCLNEDEIYFVNNLQGHSLCDFAALSQLVATEYSHGDRKLPSVQFIRSLENAARKILEATAYTKALYLTSKLHTAVLDIPAFSLTTGPCQLIVFKSFITSKGAVAAINHTFTEPLKCVPLKIYKLLAGYITDEAARIYQASTSMQSMPTYLLQQQMYRQQAGNYDSKRLYSSSGEDDIPMGPMFAERIDTSHSSSSAPSPVDPFSLPPPPRAKRNRFKLSHVMSSNSPFDLLTPLQDHQPRSPTKTLQSAPLTVLATQDRFWWINSFVEETIHN